MNYTEKHIVETYSTLFQGLSSLSKIELIQNLSKSLKTEKAIKEEKFFKSFGAFSSSQTPQDIIKDIKASRKFRSREIQL